MNLIQIRQGESVLVLHGAGAQTPFRGAVCLPEGAARPTAPAEAAGYASGMPGADERGQSEIELALEGTAAQIEAGLARLGALLDEGRRWASVPGGQHVYLEARVTPGGSLWRTRLTGGTIRTTRAGADSRALGSQAARLTAYRLGWWEGPLMELPLSNPNGAEIRGGLEISNCWDAARANYVDVDASAAGLETGDLPAPLILDFDGFETDFTGTLYAFENIYSSPTALEPVIEGENGLPGSGVSGARVYDAEASGGQYERLAWSGEDTRHIWTAPIHPAVIEQCAGRPFLPLARLANPLYASNSIWHFWRASITWNTPETVLDGPGCYLPIAASLCPGVPVFLPPWPVDAPGAGITPVGLNLELHAQAAGTGSHQLDLDFLYLLPLDGWRIYRPAVIAWGGGLKIHDDPLSGTLRAGPYGIQTHASEGPGLWLAPGRAARCYFLIERAGGGFGPGTRSRVRLYYRPRRRAL